MKRLPLPRHLRLQGGRGLSKAFALFGRKLKPVLKSAVKKFLGEGDKRGVKRLGSQLIERGADALTSLAKKQMIGGSLPHIKGLHSLPSLIPTLTSAETRNPVVRKRKKRIKRKTKKEKARKRGGKKGRVAGRKKGRGGGGGRKKGRGGGRKKGSGGGGRKKGGGKKKGKGGRKKGKSVSFSIFDKK